MDSFFSHLANRFTSQTEGLALLRERSWRIASGTELFGNVCASSMMGIVSLSCQSTMHAVGFPYNPRGVVFEGGEVRATFDVILEVADGVEPPPPEDAAADQRHT